MVDIKGTKLRYPISDKYHQYISELLYAPLKYHENSILICPPLYGRDHLVLQMWEKIQDRKKVLGEDFGIEVTPREGQPGLNFTLLVPRRLSNVEENERPVVGEDGEYIIDSKTKLPKQERYWPGDQRTRAIAAHQSYDSIKEHCEKVRAYLVTYYQKLNRPVPEFKLKQNYV